MPDADQKQVSEPQLTPDQKSASQWSSENWHEGKRIAGADSSYVAFYAFCAGIEHERQRVAEETKALRDALEQIAKECEDHPVFNPEISADPYGELAQNTGGDEASISIWASIARSALARKEGQS